MPHKVRVTFPDEAWDDMVENAPAALSDPDIVRFHVNLGMLFTQSGTDGLYDAAFALDEISSDSSDIDTDTDTESETDE